MDLSNLSREERNKYLGQWKDLQAEREQFKKEYGDNEKIEPFFNLVSKILKEYSDTGQLQAKGQVIVCNPIWGYTANWIARHFGLDYETDVVFKENEIVVCGKDDVDKVIESRKWIKKQINEPVLLKKAQINLAPTRNIRKRII